MDCSKLLLCTINLNPSAPALLRHASALLFLAQIECRDPPTVPLALAGPRWWLLKSWRGVKCSEAACVAAWVIPPTSFYSCCPGKRRQTPGQLVSLFCRQRHWESDRDLDLSSPFCSHLLSSLPCNTFPSQTIQTAKINNSPTDRDPKSTISIFVNSESEIVKFNVLMHVFSLWN